MRFKKIAVILACCLSAGVMATEHIAPQQTAIHFVEKTFTHQGQEVTAVLRDTGGELLELHSADQSEDTLNFYEELCAARGWTIKHSSDSEGIISFGKGVQKPLMSCRRNNPSAKNENHSLLNRSRHIMLWLDGPNSILRGDYEIFFAHADFYGGTGNASIKIDFSNNPECKVHQSIFVNGYEPFSIGAGCQFNSKGLNMAVGRADFLFENVTDSLGFSVK